MEMAKVTSKGQITIPVSIRRRLGINEGDKLLFIDRSDGVMMFNPNQLQSMQAEKVSPEQPSTNKEPSIPAAPMATVPKSESDELPEQDNHLDQHTKDLDTVAALLSEIRSIGSKI